MSILQYFFGRQLAARNASLVFTDEDDSVSAAATAAISASLSATDGDDTLSAAAALEIRASTALTDEDDTLAATASTTGEISASLAQTDQDDTVTASATNAISARAGVLATFGADIAAELSVAAHVVTHSGAFAFAKARATIGKSEGWFFFEVRPTTLTGTAGPISIGIGSGSAPLTTKVGAESDTWGYQFNASNGLKITDGISQSYGPTFASNDVIGVELAFDGGGIGTLTFYKNGTSLGAAFTNIPAGTYYPMVSLVTQGDAFAFNFGDSAFTFTQPTGSSLWGTGYPDENDSVSAAGTVAIAASASFTDQDDAVVATAALAIAASVSVTDESDTVTSAASTAQEISASLSQTDENDSVSATAYHDISASLSTTDADDYLSASATVADADQFTIGPGLATITTSSMGGAGVSVSGRGGATVTHGPN